jgi:hypothetical protein
MVMEGYFKVHDKPKHKKIKRHIRDSNINDPKSRNKHYREHYGL